MKPETATDRSNLQYRQGSVVSLASLLRKARRAGALLGTGRQDMAYADLMTMESLGDDQRERLGYATHMIAKAKQAGYAPAELWRYIQQSFGARHGQPMALLAADDAQLGTLAFGLGACIEDADVAGEMQGYLRAITNGRSFLQGQPRN